ncbi:GerAB/ArcD/ProY family transporter [Halalkalibacter nanhaiisediminis]|uniref:Spore germination protein n=1 Tax=Halalkalibacter nanhaiisediminis TaxID=688079 RepID=A0A562QBH2_9BACI|nr:GerAB/ArcD/ProY family transporter [Halalkalibacter nanhaiisediminis]TWI54063.1 spore germination protein [Halalkalibacter nanhaiisediminis]
MKDFALFSKTSTFGGIYALFLVNRLQLLYFIILMPNYLIDPYMIWGIIGVGILSQLNLMVLAKWLSSKFFAKGYQGYVQLLGEKTVRICAVIGLLFIFLKLTVIILGYVEIVNEFIFPSTSSYWFIFVLLLSGGYIATRGMENTIRFGVITFFSSIWMLFLFAPFFKPPIAMLYDLYPLIPTESPFNPWKRLLFIWSALGGAEYLICLAPWLNVKNKMLKHITIANGISVVEYVILFIASLFFFGSHYLNKSDFPLVHMLRYLQSPIFERVDIIFISVYLLLFSFVSALFLLFFYGAARIMMGNQKKQTTRMGFSICLLIILISLFIVNAWIWKDQTKQIFWLDLQIWFGALSYFFVPLLLYIAMKRKGRV